MKIRGVNKVTQYQFSHQIPPASLFSINLSHLKRPNEVISPAQKCLYHKISNYRQQSLRSLLGKCARAVDILFLLVRRLSIYRQGEKKALSATLSDKPFFHQGPASMRRGATSTHTCNSLLRYPPFFVCQWQRKRKRQLNLYTVGFPLLLFTLPAT